MQARNIRVGIVGYGNLGKGVELALRQAEDMTLCAVFTRRNPETLEIWSKDVPVFRLDEVCCKAQELDVLILCGGSANDLPVQTPELAKYCNTVDSFDTHAKIPEYFEQVCASAKASGHLSLISVGWDPGLFSLLRVYGDSILPQGTGYTFWGKGVSQGHSDAIRRIPGVKDAKQYTIPLENAVERVRKGEFPQLQAGEKHTRECFVVAEEGANKEEIERQIVTMPNYFADYRTTVHFISEEEFRKNHSRMAHGGFVLHTGKTGVSAENTHVMEFSLKLDSNPEFTSSVLVAYARAVCRMQKEGKTGAVSVLDVPPSYLSPKDGAALRRELL